MPPPHSSVSSCHEGSPATAGQPPTANAETADPAAGLVTCRATMTAVAARRVNTSIWRRLFRLAIALAIALTIAVVVLAIAAFAYNQGFLDRIVFDQAESGPGWRLVGTSPATVDRPVVEVVDEESSTIRLWVHSGTSGYRDCTQPTVILEGVDVKPGVITASFLWRERGCDGEPLWFEITLDEPLSQATVVEWNHLPGSVCIRFRIDGGSVEELASVPEACGRDPEPATS